MVFMGNGHVSTCFLERFNIWSMNGVVPLVCKLHGLVGCKFFNIAPNQTIQASLEISVNEVRGYQISSNSMSI